ncbi:transmembrane protein 62 isoform X2 [Rhinatrema bivittatum]|uniref:transmembrane protein 62 isoform X2 n=1 Tax=Rhinatrema bivittatum TaxID=194408 RepID=UPI00112A8501|nr:transmembrane protein 62 isoform X2 [Rhinatrema bivittatum]
MRHRWRRMMLKIAAGLLAAAIMALLLDLYSTSGPPQLQRLQARPLTPTPGAGADNIFWAVQVTDLHISKFRDPGRSADFEKFCTEGIDIIKPSLVLMTGDITDAKTKNKLGSDQFKMEWQIYQTILKRSRAMEKSKWLDIRGNHDAFNIPDLQSVRNYYRKYSALRKEGSFHYVHRTSFGNYSFICVDATLTPGPKRPYNFFGILNKEQMDELSLLAKESQHSNQSIWFGHYPTSTIISPSPGIRAVMRYRILAFDHDLFSFSDLKSDEWPVVLITNPKSALYRSSAHEPLGRMKHSSHIRILAFSPFVIASVEIRIDGIYIGTAVHVSGPLYVLKWNPDYYSTGLYRIEAKVQDVSGKIIAESHMFTLEDNTSLSFDFLPSFILLTDHYIAVQVLFLLTVLVQVSVLVAFRYLRKPTLKKPPGFVSLTSFSLHVTSKTSSVYYPLLLLSLYTALGPWFVGEVIDGHIGACFAFGVIVRGQFLQGSLTYVVGILQLAFFNFPLMVYLCWCLLLRCQGHSFCSHFRTKRLSSVPVHVLMFLLLSWQVYSCYFLLQTYGTLSFFLSPMRTWLVVMTLLLTQRTWTHGSSELKTYIVEMKTCQSY